MATGDDPRIKVHGITDTVPGYEWWEADTRKWVAYNHFTDDNLNFKTDTDIRMSIEQGGNVGIGTTNAIFGGLSPVLWTGVPSTDTSNGIPGWAAYNSSHLYICTGVNKWGRTNITGWS